MRFQKLISATLMAAICHFGYAQTDTTKADLQEILILATKAKSNNPITFSNLNKKEIEKQNFGQDLPYLLNLTPSTVVSSDAGAGIGYTNIRIRGTDPNRTNVTINGVPINDAESHGMFWVNMPDMASSSQNIQVQRGVGSSSNGAGAFGASINIQTDGLNPSAYAEVSSGYGSFNTWKNTVHAGSGLLENNWAFDARLSKIVSDGFIDRASSDLKSFFVSGTHFGKKSIFKVNIFSGKEKTYQAWNGIPEDILKAGNRTYNGFTYDNQTDNYQQDYYQMFYTYQLSKNIKAHVGLHYTYGRGYYEEFREAESFSTYKLKDTLFLVNNATIDTVTTGNFVRRRWLDNDFYGAVFSFIYEKKRLNFTLGGGLNEYVGRHFGELIWSQYTMGGNLNDRFYEGKSNKIDFNIYGKTTYQFTSKIGGFIDLQFRNLSYQLKGDDLNNGSYLAYDLNLNYRFFNPKLGVTFQLNKNDNFYVYAGIANKEPTRNDLIQANKNNIPAPEQLINYEIGYRKTANKHALGVNLYFMDYFNQLILTGQINDVGAYNRVNVPNSYRAGIELTGGWKIHKNLNWQSTLTFSQNKIVSFVEFVDDYDNGQQIAINHSNTNIALSPNVIGSSMFTYKLLPNFSIDLISKYVGKQYLDNTENENRKLNAFFINDLRINYETAIKKAFKNVALGFQLNNFMDVKYEPNGYTYSGFIGGVRSDFNFYYPQAGTNFMINLTLKF
jgi:iron complex outermembrane receptor protein